MSSLHFYDPHTSSYKMIHFLSNIYKWTPTLLMVESFLAVFTIYVIYISCSQLVCYAMIKDGDKKP